MTYPLKNSLAVDIRLLELDSECSCGAVVFTLEKFDPCLYHFDKPQLEFSGLLCMLPDDIESQNADELLSGDLHVTVLRRTDTNELLVESRCSVLLNAECGYDNNLHFHIPSAKLLCSARFESLTIHSKGVGTRNGYVKGMVSLYSIPRQADVMCTPIQTQTDPYSEVEESGHGKLESIDFDPKKRPPKVAREVPAWSPLETTESIEVIEEIPVASPTGRHRQKKKPLRHFIAVDESESGYEAQSVAEYKPGYKRLIHRASASESPRRISRPAWSTSRSMSVDSLSIREKNHQPSCSACMLFSGGPLSELEDHDRDTVVPSPSSAAPTESQGRQRSDGAVPRRGLGASNRYGGGKSGKQMQKHVRAKASPSLGCSGAKAPVQASGRSPLKGNAFPPPPPKVNLTPETRQAVQSKFLLKSPAAAVAAAQTVANKTTAGSRRKTRPVAEQAQGPPPAAARERLRAGVRAVAGAVSLSAGARGESVRNRRQARKPALPVAAKPRSAPKKAAAARVESIGLEDQQVPGGVADTDDVLRSRSLTTGVKNASGADSSAFFIGSTPTQPEEVAGYRNSSSCPDAFVQSSPDRAASAPDKVQRGTIIEEEQTGMVYFEH